MNLYKYTLERYDDGFAVLEARDDEYTQKLVPQIELERVANEGDVLLIGFNDDGKVEHVEFLKEETERLKKEIKDLHNKILNRNKNR